MAKIYQGVTGFLFKINMGRDISAASNYYIQTRKPDGTIVTWTPTIGETRKFYYYADSDDLSQIGTYIMQPYLTIGPFTGPGNPVRFSVVKAAIPSA